MTPFSVPQRNPEVEQFEHHLVDALPEHIGQFVNGEPTVLHELDSDHMHLDVLMWEPTTQRPLWTMVTSGLSAHPMKVPAGFEYFERVELVLTLPGDWPSVPEMQRMPDSRVKRFSWPILAMKHLARMTYLYGTWLGYGHSTRARRTIHQTYPKSEFSGLLMEQVLSMPADAVTFMVQEHTVHCLGLHALYPAELQYILETPHGGAHEMMHRLQEAGFYEGIIPGRSAVA